METDCQECVESHRRLLSSQSPNVPCRLPQFNEHSHRQLGVNAHLISHQVHAPAQDRTLTDRGIHLQLQAQAEVKETVEEEREIEKKMRQAERTRQRSQAMHI